MRRGVVGTILRRELRDVLRDRRTLFTMLVLPVLLYPALMLGFSHLTVSQVEKLRERTYPVMMTVGGIPVKPGEGAPAEGTLARHLIEVEQFAFMTYEDPEDAVKRGDLLLAVDIPADVEARLAAGEEVRLLPIHRSADERSRTVWRSFRGAVAKYRQSKFPLVIDEDVGDQATPEQKGGHLFGGMLAMMVIMMAMTGAFYPALDVGAGEKERGTLETLLLSPATRLELVAGKYLTVLTVAVVAALMNLGSMALTFSGFSSIISAGGGAMSFGISPAAFVVILVGLIIMAALFSAVCLALSTFARTYKEGQAYLTPALLLVMPLGMIGLLPDTELDSTLAVIPVANMALLMKGLLVGNFPTSEIVITLITCLTCAFAALLWTTGLFSREEVLFREGKQVFGLRPPPGVPRPKHPPAQAAVLAVVFGLVWFIHAGGWLAGSPPWMQIVIPQLGLAALALGLPRLAMVRLRTGMMLAPPANPRAWLAGALLGVGGVGVSLAIGALQRQDWLLGPPPESSATVEILTELFTFSPVVVILCAAVVPALAEELLFRGLVLQAFRGMAKNWGAIAISAIAFGLFHMSAHRIFPQATLGVLLGVMVMRTGSLWPAIVAHMIHNGLLVGWALGGEPDAEPSPEVLPWLYAAGPAIVFLGFLLVRPSRRDPPSVSESVS